MKRTLMPIDLTRPNYRTLGQRERDAARLVGVHPYLARVIRRILDAMEILHCPMLVTEGVRTDEQQARLFAQGRSMPGRIVTNTDGYHRKSLHQKQVTGYGHAVDCAFLDDPNTERIEVYDQGQPWEMFGTMLEAYGLTWGGRWATLVDKPHAELDLHSPLIELTDPGTAVVPLAPPPAPNAPGS